MFKNLILQNSILFRLGCAMFAIFFILLVYYPYNTITVLGINSVIKPMKFALSIWIYSWTMAVILNYVDDKKKVKLYSYIAFVCMTFEQAAITFQALKGELSHFNTTNKFGVILFTLMGVFILTITLWTAYITYIFFKQKNYSLAPSLVISIKIGLVLFVLFSLFGGYISSLQGHTIGANDGGKGLWFLNWSTLFGDLRVAHFFGIHSLQIIPLFAIVFIKIFNKHKSIIVVKIFALTYFVFILIILIQGILGLPFIK